MQFKFTLWHMLIITINQRNKIVTLESQRSQTVQYFVLSFENVAIFLCKSVYCIRIYRPSTQISRNDSKLFFFSLRVPYLMYISLNCLHISEYDSFFSFQIICYIRKKSAIFFFNF